MFDCKKYREQFPLQYLQNYIHTHHYRIYEQDTLNVLLDGHIKFLGHEWNMYTYTNESIERCVSYAPYYEKQEYFQARKNPKCIHYAAHPKPWWVAKGDFAIEFWKYARISPFYEEILYKFLSDFAIQRFKESLPAQETVNVQFPTSGPIEGLQGEETKNIVVEQVNEVPILHPIQQQMEIPIIDERSSARKFADRYLPYGTKRRAFVKRLVPRDSLRWRVAKRIYFVFAPQYKKKK